ncbi:MAG: hypothetical protein R3F48_15200 [Candidatus Zixiibacteriota bacterium]
MYLTWLEKLAIKETGRKIAADAARKKSRLIVYPQELTLADITAPYLVSNNEEHFSLAYSIRPLALPGRIWRYLRFALSCLRYSFVTNADVFVYSGGCGRVYGLMATILIRLFGGRVTIHDYRFHDEVFQRSRLRSLGRQIEFGVLPEHIPADSKHKRISCRSEIIPDALYDIPAKSQAAPKVFVYGDFARNRVVSLARRVHDLVKQKYPRTEFVLVGLFPEELTAIGHATGIYSIRAESPASETELAKVISDSDIGLFLSPGGLTRFYSLRAMRAHIPLFTNGFSLENYDKDSREYVATRDSYSDIAAKIVALVDDPELYVKRATRSK